MAKKNWISICQNSSNTTYTEQIVWEPSSSEDESSWSTHLKLPELYTRPTPTIQVVRRCCYNSSAPVESPILNSKCSGTNQVSPILSRRTIPSPIIERRRLKAKRREKLKTPLFKDYRSSPELFQTQSTQVIENESPTFDLFHSQVLRIEPFPSQFGSSVETDEVNENSPCLYYQPPKRRRTYKKGSVAHQLQKLLKQKKSRIQIWYLEKLKNIDNPLDEHTSVIYFKFRDSWTEYGNTLLKCEETLNRFPSEADEQCQDPHKVFIINLGASQVQKTEFEDDGVYELCPPYRVDRVNYNDNYIPYFYNVFKVVKIDRQ